MLSFLCEVPKLVLEIPIFWWQSGPIYTKCGFSYLAVAEFEILVQLKIVCLKEISFVVPLPLARSFQWYVHQEEENNFESAIAVRNGEDAQVERIDNDQVYKHFLNAY